MIAKTYGATLQGIDPLIVTIEADLQRGLPKFEMVGLPHTDVREGKNRILSSLQTLGVSWKSKRIIVNLAPASFQKEGASLDLPIALALLKSLGVVRPDSAESHICFGELSLDGKIQPIRGAMAVAHCVRGERWRGMIVSRQGVPDVAGMGDIEILAPEDLAELVAHLRGERCLSHAEVVQEDYKATEDFDWSEVGGQGIAKRALEIAAAGHHNILLAGPPGVGKSLLARRIGTILPKLELEESLEVQKIHNVAGREISAREAANPPLRIPHHHASLAGMIGGGKPFRPGEFSMAHRGVLFMDEVPEYRRDVIEALREPLEEGIVSVARAELTLLLPARFLLVAAMNLCPCGVLGDPRKVCFCPPTIVERYRRKLSGPVRDRMDLWVSLTRPTVDEVLGGSKGEESRDVLARVKTVREIQYRRNGGAGRWNGRLSPKQIKEIIPLDSAAIKLLGLAVERFGLSARGIHKVMAVARTIADLDQNEAVLSHHLAEALAYRELKSSED